MPDKNKLIEQKIIKYLDIPLNLINNQNLTPQARNQIVANLRLIFLGLIINSVTKQPQWAIDHVTVNNKDIFFISEHQNPKCQHTIANTYLLIGYFTPILKQERSINCNQIQVLHNTEKQRYTLIIPKIN